MRVETSKVDLRYPVLAKRDRSFVCVGMCLTQETIMRNCDVAWTYFTLSTSGAFEYDHTPLSEIGRRKQRQKKSKL
jgi:hypothetical protein